MPCRTFIADSGFGALLEPLLGLMVLRYVDPTQERRRRAASRACKQRTVFRPRVRRSVGAERRAIPRKAHALHQDQ